MADYAISSDMLNNNPEMKQYFESLPPYVQETMRQSSGSQITSLEQLQKTAENLIRK